MGQSNENQRKNLSELGEKGLLAEIGPLPLLLQIAGDLTVFSSVTLTLYS